MNNILQNSHPLKYDGKIKGLYGIFVKNFLLRIFTLGIYSFWGKTRLRYYIISSFNIEGDRFEYTGTGKELFRGFLKALFLFILPLFATQIGLSLLFVHIQRLDISETMNKTAEISLSLTGTFFYILIGFAIIYSQYSYFRYMVARIQWRGIRFKLTGSFLQYFILTIKTTFMNIISFGLLVSKSDHSFVQYFVKNLFIGNTNLIFIGNPKELFYTNLKTLLLSIPTLGFSRCWYQAALNRYRFKHLHLGDIKFSCSQTGYQILKINLGNLFILLFTLGLGIPIIYNRKARFLSKSLMITGNLNDIKIKQTTTDKINATGEELSELLDVDLDVAFF